MQTNFKRLDDNLARMAGGDKDALADLYHATRDAVFGFALSILKNAHDAEDVLQDTYVALWQAAGDYTALGKPMAFILTVTRSLCLQKLRQHKRQADLSGGLGAVAAGQRGAFAGGPDRSAPMSGTAG